MLWSLSNAITHRLYLNDLGIFDEDVTPDVSKCSLEGNRQGTPLLEGCYPFLTMQASSGPFRALMGGVFEIRH